jgi:hypothetical protein
MLEKKEKERESYKILAQANFKNFILILLHYYRLLLIFFHLFFNNVIQYIVN